MFVFVIKPPASSVRCHSLTNCWRAITKCGLARPMWQPITHPKLEHKVIDHSADLDSLQARADAVADLVGGLCWYFYASQNLHERGRRAITRLARHRIFPKSSHAYSFELATACSEELDSRQKAQQMAVDYGRGLKWKHVREPRQNVQLGTRDLLMQHSGRRRRRACVQFAGQDECRDLDAVKVADDLKGRDHVPHRSVYLRIIAAGSVFVRRSTRSGRRSTVDFVNQRSQALLQHGLHSTFAAHWQRASAWLRVPARKRSEPLKPRSGRAHMLRMSNSKGLGDDAAHG